MSTYNGEKYIEQQLDSIFTSPQNIFLYVRDDGSKDRTIEILKDYRIKHAVSIEVNEGENVGSAESFLMALRECPKAEYYAFWMMFGLTGNCPQQRNKLAQQINLFCGAQIIK
mgnify:CR=1 FL=1